MISILYRSKMQKNGHGLTLQNGMDRGSFSTFSAVLLFVVSSLPLVRQTESEQNRCAMACQGCGAAFYFF